jgi:hypothetical protein
MTKKRFIKLCMAKVEKRYAEKLAVIAQKLDSYKNAYAYVEALGINEFYLMFH